MKNDTDQNHPQTLDEFILSQFQSVLGSTVSKEGIFFWVYGALHSPSYRKNFDADLKKQLPRLPLPKDMPTFKRVMKIGRELASLQGSGKYCAEDIR